MRRICSVLFFLSMIACQNSENATKKHSDLGGVIILPNTKLHTVVTLTDLESKDYLDPPSNLPMPFTIGEWSGIQKHRYEEKINAKASYHSPSDTIFKITVILDGSSISVKQMNSIIILTDSIVNERYPRFEMIAVDLLLQRMKN